MDIHHSTQVWLIFICKSTQNKQGILRYTMPQKFQQFLKGNFFLFSSANKKTKCSNNPYSPQLQDFLAVISITQSIIKHFGSFMPLYNRTTAPVLPFFSSPVTLDADQGHSYWYQNTESGHILHQFERNWLISIQTQNYQITKNWFLSFEYQFMHNNLPWASTNTQVMAADQISSKSIMKFTQK